MTLKFIFTLLLTCTIPGIRGSDADEANMLNTEASRRQSRTLINESSRVVHSIGAAVAEMRKAWDRRNHKTLELHQAVECRKVDDIRRLLAAETATSQIDKAVNKRNENGDTPLLIESKSDEPGPEVIELLLAADTWQAIPDDNGLRAICHVARKGHMEKMRALIRDKGFGPCYCGLVYYAMLSQKPDMIELVIASGAPVTDVDDATGFSPLSYSAWHNDIPLAKYFITLGGLKDESSVHSRHGCQGRKNPTPVQVATARNHQNMLTLLLNSGANPNLRIDEQSLTALMEAVVTNNVPVATMLIDAKADLGAVHKYQRSASFLNPWAKHTISSDRGNEEYLVDVEETALDKARKQGNQAMIKLLNDRGARSSSSCPMQ